MVGNGYLSCQCSNSREGNHYEDSHVSTQAMQDTEYLHISFRILEAAGVLTSPENGWNLNDFVDTEFATLV